LLVAGLVEVAFALSIEPTKGFTRPLQTALCLVLGAGSIYLLTHALKTLPIGTAYAVFTGIGGTVIAIGLDEGWDTATALALVFAAGAAAAAVGLAAGRRVAPAA